MGDDDLTIEELEQIYERCDADGVLTDEELQELIDELNALALGARAFSLE